ncbi:DUF6543 domain-containing protein [Collimonas sp. H4R21]|uniref:DUF6543 domain-containing protein n=1 Tax=Collimonas rhizosphaerae TaxID=3126357 RepID=A0ABU9PYL2_9BURK
MSISSSSQFPPVIRTPYNPPPIGPSVSASKAPEPNDEATDDKGSERPSRSTNSVSTASALTGSSVSGSGASSQPTTNGADVVNGQIDKLEQSSANSEKVFAQKPSLMEKLAEKFAAQHPKVPRPIDLTKTYVNTYRITRVPGHTDENGVYVFGKTVRTLESSKSVADWIADKYASGPGVNPLDNDILANSTLGRGIYSDPTAVEESAEIGGVSVRDLQRFLDQPGTGDDLEKTAIDQNNEYYSQPNSQTGGLSVKQWLVNTRKERIRTEADLRVGDGTLQPKSKKLIDTVMANPTLAELEKLPVDQRPNVTPLSIRFDLNSQVADTPIPGAFYMSTPQAAGKGSGADDAALVLSIPGEALREFDSEDAMNGYIDARSHHPEERKSLLNLLQAQVRSAVGETRFTLSPSDSPKPRIDANRNFFEYSVQGQIDQQNADIRYEFGQAKVQRADLNVFDAIGKSANAPLRQSFDTRGVLEERDAQLLEANSPAWRQNATDAQLRQLEEVEKKREASEEKVRDLAAEKKIPPLPEFTNNEINAAIEKKYPGWRIYPEQVTVSITELTPGARIPGTVGSAGAPTPTTNVKQVPVVEYFLGNNPPWDASSRRQELSMTLIDSKGNRKKLSSDEIKKMVTDANVGQKYQDKLKETFLSSGGQDLRVAWTQYQTAKMDVDAKEARLQGVFSEDSPERPAYDWVESVIQYPDAKTRPKISGQAIQAEALIIGGSAPHYRRGFSVDGVMAIGPKNGAVVLCTPEAPDGLTMQVFASREEMAQSPRLRTPEMVAYLMARVSENGQVEVAKLGGPATGGPYRGPTTVGTHEIRGNVQDEMYTAHVNMMIANANVQSTTNAERNKQSALNIFNTAVDIVNYLLMIPGAGRIAGGVRGLFRSPNIRSQLAKLKTLPRLFKKRGPRGEDTIDLLPRSSTSSSTNSLSSRRLSADIDPTKLKHVGKNIFADPSTNKQYLLYRSTWVETFTQGEKRFIRDPQNPLEPMEMKKIGEEWVPQLQEEVAIPEKPSKTRAERNAELPTDLSSRPFDENALMHYRIELINYLSTEGNQETFLNFLDIQAAKGNISLDDRAAILVASDPYERAKLFLELYESRSPEALPKFPAELMQAIGNGTEVTLAKESVAKLIAEERKTLADLPAKLEANGPFDQAAMKIHRKELMKLLSADSNKDTFSNLLDIQAAKGNISLDDRAAILAESNPNQRARLFLQLYESRSPEALPTFPAELTQAIANGTEVTLAKESVAKLIAEERKTLADLPAKLEANGPFDQAAMKIHRKELMKLLSADSNKGTLTRLIDYAYFDGEISAADAHQLRRTPNPHERARLFLERYEGRNPKTLPKFPAELKQAILDTPEFAPKEGIRPDFAVKDRNALADLPAKLEANGPFDQATMKTHRKELIKLLSADSNKGTLTRLIDYAYFDGEISAVDAHQLRRTPDPYERARLFLERYESSNPKTLPKFPAELKQAILDTPEIA